MSNPVNASLSTIAPPEEDLVDRLRAPLAAIRGWADVILAEGSRNPNIEAAGRGLLDAVAELSRLTASFADADRCRH